MIRPMARPLLGALPLERARRVLDLGSGTGGLVAELCAAAPRARVVAVDRSLGMLRIAARSHDRHGAVMDAERLALRAQSFDLAVLAFVLFHVPEPTAALREVGRVLRARGVVGITTWGEDPGTPGTEIWTDELDRHGAGPDPRDPRVMQQPRMNAPEKLIPLLREAGFREERAWRERFEHRWTPNELFALQVGCGMPARRLASLSAPAAAACRERVRARLAQLSAEALVYRPEVLFAVAERPG